MGLGAAARLPARSSDASLTVENPCRDVFRWAGEGAAGLEALAAVARTGGALSRNTDADDKDALFVVDVPLVCRGWRCR